LAFGMGWISHYFLDSLPHWERLYKPQEDIDWNTQEPTRSWPRHIFVQAIIDVLLSTLFIAYLVWRVPHGDHFWQNPVFWGAFGGVFPDLLDNVPFWNGLIGRWPFFKQERFVHQYLHVSEAAQEHLPKYLGLLTQVAVFLFAMWLLLSS